MVRSEPYAADSNYAVTTLYEKFQSLSSPHFGGYTGIFLDDQSYLVARDSTNLPVFLIMHPAARTGRSLTFELEGLQAILDFSATVSLGEELVDGNFAFIRCSDNDEQSKRYFLELCGTLSLLIGPNPTAARIEEGISTLVRMFSLRKSPPKNTIVGLLGELLFIDQHADVPACIRAWHVTPRDIIDFTFMHHALEVKATTHQGRSHRLTFEQTRGFPRMSLFFLSIRVSEITNGLSGYDLMRILMDRCGDDVASAIRLWEMVCDTLGSHLQDFMDYCFSYESAVDSMEFYESLSLPAIRGDIPAGVSQVTFVADFTIAQPVVDTVKQRLLGCRVSDE